MLRIITDSTSSIPQELRENMDIELFNLFVRKGDEEYEEGLMDLDSFYSQIDQMVDDIPTSSQPSLGVIQSALEAAAKAGDQVLGLFLSSKMSGTFESVVKSAKAVKERYPSFKCSIIDSLANCMELGWAVVEAAKARNEGADLEGCAQRAQESTGCTRFVFAPESLRFLKAGGRIGAASAMLGNMLNITPILTVKDGIASTLTKVRTQKKAMDKMVDILRDDIRDFGLKNVAVHYIGARDKAEKWASEVIEPLVGRPVLVTPASPVIGVHVGPAVGIAYECCNQILGKFDGPTKPELVSVC